MLNFSFIGGLKHPVVWARIYGKRAYTDPSLKLESERFSLRDWQQKVRGRAKSVLALGGYNNIITIETLAVKGGYFKYILSGHIKGGC